jgi:heterotetrameric sarcosine oxidase delta subunit
VLLIPCPWCGPREETEFRCGGQANVVVPPPDVDDATWSHYLYYRSNSVGRYAEQWVHINGCRRWFNLIRDVTTHEISKAYLPGESPEPAQ